MSRLLTKTRHQGPVAHVTCTGRIAAGPECEELDSLLQELLNESGTVELDLAAVDFLDSSGIGILVRNLVRARNQRKVLKLTELSPQVRKTLEVTSLLGQFRVSETSTRVRSGLRVLFVHPSSEIRTFVSSLLNGRGAQANTCASLYDARLLMNAGETDVVVLAAGLDAPQFEKYKMLRLHSDFFDRPADEASEELLAKIKAAVD